MKAVILDNYDSFTFNLYQLVGIITGEKALVFRNDELTYRAFQSLSPDRIIISPGPGNFSDGRTFGICTEVILGSGRHTPLLGVCLGHQGIVHAFGGRIIRAKEPMHGKASPIYHHGEGIFRGVRNGFEAMRYHSLIAEGTSMPPLLKITAATSDGTVMGVEHREFPIYGIQFHPESIGTRAGKRILANFLIGKDR
jgi:anthranilate synthase component 2